MRTSLPVPRERQHRRALSSVALVTTVLALATGCTQPAAAPVEEHTFGMHQVASSGHAGVPVTELSSRDVLDVYSWEVTESALAAMEWFLAGDCSEPAPSTEEFVVACDSRSSTIFILRPAALTAQDIASAELLTSDPNDVGFNRGDLSITFTEDGAGVFSTLTAAVSLAESPANQIAIVVDGVVVSAPEVQQQITGGSAVVTSAEPDREWESLAAWLNAQAGS